MASAEGGRIGAVCVEGCPLPSRLRGPGVWGSAPSRNAFWHILKATERYFLHLYADALSLSNSFMSHWAKAEVWGLPHAHLSANTTS